MTKRTLTFQRTTVERVTMDFDQPDSVTEKQIQYWALSGFNGQSPFDVAPLEFQNRTTERSKWTLVSAEPPWPKVQEVPPRKRTRHSSMNRQPR
jgi:hypothetical protein